MTITQDDVAQIAAALRQVFAETLEASIRPLREAMTQAPTKELSRSDLPRDATDKSPPISGIPDRQPCPESSYDLFRLSTPDNSAPLSINQAAAMLCRDVQDVQREWNEYREDYDRQQKLQKLRDEHSQRRLEIHNHQVMKARVDAEERETDEMLQRIIDGA